MQWHVNTSILISGNSPGARKEEQVQAEFEITQVRDRDDTLKGSRLSTCRSQNHTSWILFLFNPCSPSTIRVVTTKTAEARRRRTKIESRILRLNAGLQTCPYICIEILAL